ncbi:MAG: M43 family zinc metalloprotease [Flavobacteriales bacterium]|nr:M43 family zinc metalloprotease [Flavobacteriales bacterium]MDW8432362.1 M43 family zinc metalloprotease [Flavobacteriales bacterium]
METGNKDTDLLYPYCASDELALDILKKNPDLAFVWKKIQERAQNAQDSFNPMGFRDTSADFTLPVVVHIIHQDGAENISPAQVLNGIDILTRNFRKRNPDTIDIVPFFKPIAADCKIQFVLARRDPDGECHPGYTRQRSPLSLTGNHDVKSLIHWPRDRYVNIYVTRDAAGLAGHALMPFQADTLPQWDGIVIRYDYYGNIGTSNDYKSVVLTHEAGHFLNLFHVWGGNNVPGFYYLPVGQSDNCNYDDDVMDTPNTIGWTNCNLNANSCDTLPDNVQNYMDYAYCARMFTYGQKQRMQAALLAPVAERNMLSTTGNLDAAGLTTPAALCAARIWAPRRIACPGQSLTFFDDSYHGASGWFWDFGDGTTSTQRHPTHTYVQSGVFDVTLTVTDGQNSLTQTYPTFVRVNPAAGLSLPFERSFDDGLDDFFREPDGPVTAEITQSAAWSQPHSLVCHEQVPNSRGRQVLTSPPLNLSASSAPAIKFRYAFARRHANNKDRLTLKISRDCGATWVTRFQAEGDSLETTPGPVPSGFVPESGHWREVTLLNIPGVFKIDGFMLRFEYLPDGGNPLWLDDVWLGEASQLTTEEGQIDKLCSIYPNPCRGFFSFSGCDLKSLGPYLYLENLMGQAYLLQNINQNLFNVESIPAGIWIVRISGVDKVFKLIKF